MRESRVRGAPAKRDEGVSGLEGQDEAQEESDRTVRGGEGINKAPIHLFRCS